MRKPLIEWRESEEVVAGAVHQQHAGVGQVVQLAQFVLQRPEAAQQPQGDAPSMQREAGRVVIETDELLVCRDTARLSTDWRSLFRPGRPRAACRRQGSQFSNVPVVSLWHTSSIRCPEPAGIEFPP